MKCPECNKEMSVQFLRIVTCEDHGGEYEELGSPSGLLKERAENQHLQEKLGNLRQAHTNLLLKYKAVKKNLSAVSRQYHALSQACELQDWDDFEKELNADDESEHQN
jgi:hypothetical protein